jgi:hypothetical protein
MGASAIAVNVTDPALFRNGREFAAWLGMTPKQKSSGVKERLGRSSKRGDKCIRCLLVAGAVAVLRHTCNRTTKDAAWVRNLLACKPTKLAAVALANKTARIVWEVMASGRAPDREDTDNSRRNAARSLDRDPISELYQGQRSYAPHDKAGHMTAPDHIAKNVPKNPRTRGPSTYNLVAAPVAANSNSCSRKQSFLWVHCSPKHRI